MPSFQRSVLPLCRCAQVTTTLIGCPPTAERQK